MYHTHTLHTLTLWFVCLPLSAVFQIEGGEPGFSSPKLKFPPEGLLTSTSNLYYFPAPRASCALPFYLKNHDSVWNTGQNNILLTIY